MDSRARSRSLRRGVWALVALALAAVAYPAAANAASSATGDFNGDGRDDLAIGVPTEDRGTLADSGAVNVVYGSASGLSAAGPPADQLFTQGDAGIGQVAEAGDQFGRALAVADFNGDGRDDLAVSAHLEDITGTGGALSDAGIVHVIYGSPVGLSPQAVRSDQIFSQDSPGVVDIAESDDRFASALAGGDFNNDGADDLAVGVPLEDTAALFDVGVMHVVYGSPAGLRAAGNERMSQNATENGVPVLDTSENGDGFGGALAAGDFDADGADDLAVGVELEAVAGETDAGAVNVLYGLAGATPAGGLGTAGNQFWTQNSPGIADAVEGSDRLGLALAAGDIGGNGREDLAIGVPGESVGVPNDPTATNDAGAVNVIYGGASGLSATANQHWTQDNPDVEDAAEEFDFFGIGLAIGDFNGDSRGDLAMGAPSEVVTEGGADRFDAGAVNVLYAMCTSVNDCRARAANDQFLSQASPNVEGVADDFERFGQVLAAANFDGAGGDDLAAGVPADVIGPPNDEVEAGGVNVIYATAAGLNPAGPPADQLLAQGSGLLEGVPESGDAFGAALAPGGSTGLDSNLVSP